MDKDFIREVEMKGLTLGADLPALAETLDFLKPPDEAIEGEGFRIDLTWLSESKKALKWTDDTAKTFLASKYKVSPEGTLTEVLQRLTREQAEDFTNVINSRVEKQPKLI